MNYSLKDLETFSLDGFDAVKHIAIFIDRSIKQGKKRICLFIEEAPAYPNICAPLAGMIDYFKKHGIIVELRFLGDPFSYVSQVNIENPHSVENEDKKYLLDQPFDKIWTFETPKGQNELVNSIILALREADLCGDGMFSGLEWCLNETMDNVLVHSEVKKGFVMAQYHPTNKLFSVCVFDYGIGIYNSFKYSKHHPRSKSDAITLALQEKITRDDKIGQGNGLWGLHQIIENNGGTLKVISDGAYYQMVFDESGDKDPILFERGNTLIFNNEVGSTIIDFQMRTDHAVDVAKAIKSPFHTDLWEENLENDSGDYEIIVSEMSKGTGTRPAAIDLKNIVLNLILNNNKKVILDFAGIGTLGSSYADELIGKIIAEYGLLFFNKKIVLKNLKGSNAAILERSVKQRMAQSYYDQAIADDDFESLDN